MDFTAEFEREVKRASKLLGLKVAREIPRYIRVVERLPGRGCALREGEILHVLASLAPDHLPFLIAKEAAVTLMVPEVDSVPQIHDLGWIYSDAPKELWLRCRHPPEEPFHDYDPYELFSLLQARERYRVLGTLMNLLNASAKRGALEFPMYFALLNRITTQSVEFTDSDKKLVEILMKNPSATSAHMKRMGMGGSAISRSMRKLKTLGVISGPESVDHRRLGLTTLIVTFPNRKACRDAFWRFPYTHSMFIPLSADVDVHTYLSYPSKGVEDLLSLRELGLEMALVRETSLELKFDPPVDTFEAVGSVLQGNHGSVLPDDRFAGAPDPPIKVDRVHLLILNLVLERGRVSVNFLAEKGIREARKRLRELRNSGIVRNSYLVGFPRGAGRTLVKVRKGMEDLPFFSKVLGSSGSAVIQHLEGDPSYLVGMLVVEPKAKGDLFRILRTLYGDDLLIAEDFIGVEPGWRFPVELWDEGSQTFLWEGPLAELRVGLSACLRD